MKSVGKPDAVAPHVRFDERGWETGLYATAPILDSTAHNIFDRMFKQHFLVEINLNKATPRIRSSQNPP
jgi:hypothetical protein